MKTLTQTYSPEVVPSVFKDRNDEDHQEWVNKTFEYSGIPNKNSLFKHQRIVRDYMQLKSPYRGILLYHGLGTGKTLSAIAISEIFVNEKEVIVLLPANLENNFFEELYKFGNETYIKKKHWIKKEGKKSWKTDNSKESNYNTLNAKDKLEIDVLIKRRIAKRMTFIRYNGLNKERFKQLSPTLFENKIIIIDEVHNFISRVVNNSPIFKSLYKMILNATNIKLVCLSGTPLINYPQEFALIMNLIAGPLNIYKVKLFKKSMQNIHFLENDDRIQSVIQPKADHNELHILLNKDVDDSIHNILEDNNIVSLKNGVTSQHTYRIPLNEKIIWHHVKGISNKEKESIDFFKNSIKGLVSYFYYYDPVEYPVQKPIKIEYITMSDMQFKEYREARRIEFSNENPDEDDDNNFTTTKINNTMFKNINLDKKKFEDFFYFKVLSRVICNYVFPNVKKQRLANKKVDVDTFFQLAKSKGYFKLDQLDTYAPKIVRILKNMKKTPGPYLIYSQYRTVEGLGALEEVLKEQKYSEIRVKKSKGELRLKADKSIDAKHFIVFSNTSYIQILMDVFNKNYSNLPKSINDDLMTLQNKNIDVIMITQAGSEGISLKGVRQVHVLEPYWNYVRLMQIIGRAVRAKSHIHLAKDEQVVDVYLYIMKFEKEQAEEMKWDEGRLSEKGLTSDEMIYKISNRKNAILQMLLELMKETAMDCKVHLKVHQKTEPRIKCLEN